MHKSSMEKMNWFKNKYLDDFDNIHILDVGSLDNSGNNYNYRFLFDKPNWTYVGLDFEQGNNVDILVNNIYHWNEINDSSYDVVISGQLFEHLAFFWILMDEIDRILKPGGFCCIVVPSNGPKHGSYEFDGYRFNENGMKAIAEYVNFDILHISINENAKPWFDNCLVCKKKGILNFNNDYLEKKVKNIEYKFNNLDEYID